MSETTPEDRAEQVASPSRDAERTVAPDLPLEASEADAAEQAVAAAPGQHVADEGGDAGTVPLEADPADAAEQSVVLEDDPDERR